MRFGSEISQRMYSAPKDLELMLDLIRRARPPQEWTDYPGLVNFQEMLQSPEIRAGVRLWLRGDELVAYAAVDSSNNLLFDCSAGDLESLGDEIVAWGLARLEGTEARTLDASCREEDQTRIAFLESRGFQRSPVETIAMERDLSLPIPDPVLPPGFTIRSVEGEREAAALAELHRAAFGTDQVTTAERLSWMRVPEYDPALDLVALAPDGRFAAYCMCSISREQNLASGRLEGQTDPVGTHPRYQGLGLARALLACGLGLLRERGMQTAGLGTRGDNPAMQRAAQSVGFRVTARKIWFEKAIQ